MEASGCYVIKTLNFTKLHKKISKHSTPRLTVSLPEWQSIKGYEHMQVYIHTHIYIYSWTFCVIDLAQNVHKFPFLWAEPDYGFDVIRANRCSHVEIHYSVHKHCKLRNNFKRLHIIICFA